MIEYILQSIKKAHNKISWRALLRVGLLVLIFSFVVVPHASAGFFTGIGLTIVGETGTILVNIISFFLWLAGTMFHLALVYNLDFTNKLGAIKIGWQLSRDIANFFFIAILLVIAMGTILRVGGYAAKQLLPKLIIMALLINFSLTIAFIPIDISNVLGLQFYNAITDNNTKSVSDVVMGSTGLQHIFDFTSPDAGALESAARSITQGLAGSISSFASPKAIEAVKSSIAGDSGAATAFAITAWGNAVMMSVLVFVFFIAACLLLVRAVVLSVLLVLAPLAFLFYILPETQKHWNKWWDTMIQYCFFLPAFLFMVYFAMVFVAKLNLANSSGGGNFVDNPTLIFGYLLVIILLVQALIVGRSMGIYGAGTVMGWAKSGRKMATGFVGRNTVGRAATLLGNTGAVNNAEKWLQENKTLSRFGLNFAAAGAVRGAVDRGKQVGQGQKQAEQVAESVIRQGKQNWQGAYANMNRAQKEAFLRKLNKDDRKQFVEQLPADQQALARRIIGTALPTDQALDFEAAQYQNQPEGEEKLRSFGRLSRGAQERVLRSMNPDQKADMVKKLRTLDPAAATIAEDIVKNEFSPADQDSYIVAREKQKTLDQRVDSFINDPAMTDRQRAAILLNMDTDTRKNFLEKVESAQMGPPLPGTQRVNPEQIMNDYFSPDKLMEQRAAFIDSERDPKKKADLFDTLDPQQKEFYLTKRLKDEKQRAKFLSAITDPAKQQAARDILKSVLSPVDFAKVQAEEHNKKTPAEQQAEIDSLDDVVVEEILKSKKTPIDLQRYLNSLTEEQSMRAWNMAQEALSRDELDDYYVHRYGQYQSAQEQVGGFRAANEKQRAKILRNTRGRARSALLLGLSADPDMYSAVTDTLNNYMTPAERDTMHREMCGSQPNP